MKLQISTKDHGVITSDSNSVSSDNLCLLINDALTNEGYLRFLVNGVMTTVPHGVLNTSIIKIVEES